MSLIEDYKEACDYSIGKFNEAVIKQSLKYYLKCLGVKRNVIRLKMAWADTGLIFFKTSIKLFLISG